MSYSGISQEALEFLMQVRLLDSREWYEEQKPRYREILLKPFQELVTDLTPCMERIDPDFCTIPSVGKTISRIRRDTRFTNDKHLYRDTMWLMFRQKVDRDEVPGFFFEISPVSWRYGMGFTWISPSSMQKMRTAFQSQYRKFQRATRWERSSSGFTVRGQTFKRDRFPELKEPLKHWCNLREMYVAKDSTDMEALRDPKLPELLAKDFELLAELYRFFWEVLHQGE